MLNFTAKVGIRKDGEFCVEKIWNRNKRQDGNILEIQNDNYI